MRHVLRCILLPFLFFTISLQVVSDDKDTAILGDIETVSIATGMERPVITAPAVASVYSAKYIKNSGARNLSDILNMVPGIHIGISAINYSPVYSVRGFSSAFARNILIMIDSVPQDDFIFSNKAITQGRIPIDMIERVEVSRGPGSALWGADAFSAVVNIITKTKPPDTPSIEISSGSYDTRNARGYIGKHIGDHDLTTAFEYSTTDSHNPTITQDQQTLLDEKFGTNASLAPGKASTGFEASSAQINFSDDYSRLGLRAYHVNRDMGIGLAAALDPFGSIESEGFAISYQYNNDIADSVNIGTILAYSKSHNTYENLHFFPPGAFGIFPDGVILNEENKQDFIGLSTAFRYSGIKNHYLTLGIGGERSDFNEVSESRNYNLNNGLLIPTDMNDTLSNPILGTTDDSRNLHFVYLQDEWAVHSDWYFTLGIRYDKYSDYGSVTTQRAVLQWNTTYALTTKLLYGRSYRLPTSTETNSQHIPSLEANPGLKPEKLDQIQLVFDYRPLPGLKGRVDFFYHKTDDQIRYQNSTGGPTFRPENVGDQIGRGFELELWWDIATRTKLYSFYAYQDNTDKTTNKDAGYSPHHKLFAMLQQKIPGQWFFNTKATYIGNRDRVAEDTRSKSDTYTFVDILVRKKLTRNIETTLEIRNIFDKDAEEAGFGTSFPVDMPLPGRNYLLTLSAKY